MLHWFLKFLIPKLKVKDPDQDKLDELLNSVDLSTYGLERSHLEVKIGLDASETELEPQNPNVRGGHFGDGDKDPLDEIVRAFNERHFAGWEATPEEQRVKFVNIAKHVMSHADFKAQVEDNPDSQNRQLALERLIQQAISVERRRELDLYKRYASDPDFKRAFDASVSRLLASSTSATLLART
jgi:type I restriction enzyme R subunit